MYKYGVGGNEVKIDGNGLIGFYIGRDFGGTSAGGFMALPQKKDFSFYQHFCSETTKKTDFPWCS